MLGKIKVNLGHLTIEYFWPGPKRPGDAIFEIIKFQQEIDITPLAVRQASYPGSKVLVRLDGEFGVHTSDPAMLIVVRVGPER
jgi:hypothetical protein